MSESLQIDKWLTNKFTNDSVINGANNQGVNSSRIPPGAKFPRIVFSLQAGRDVRGNAAKRLLSSPLYLIKTVVKGGITADVVTIANRIDEILENTTNETYEGYIFSTRREQEINYTEQGTDASDYFRHIGGLYRIDCYKHGV